MMDFDPMLGMVAASQLIQRDRHQRGQQESAPRLEADELIRHLEDLVPGHPDCQALARCLRPDAPLLTYPPMLSAIYRQLSEAGADDGTAVVAAAGSYAEHAGAASTNTGNWLVWPSPDNMGRPATSPTGDMARIPPIPLAAANLDLLVAVDTARLATTLTYRIMLRAVRWLPAGSGLADAFARKLAAWRTAELHLAGALKIAAYGSAVAAVRSGTTALTLTRLDASRVAAATGIPLRLAASVQYALTARLGGSMTIPEEKAAVSTEGDTTTRRLASPVSRAVAAVTLLAFAGLVVWMLASASASEQVWQRQMYVFASVEAIAFAAAGALFGVEVKRQEAAKAEQRMNQAVEEAAEAKRSERLASEDAEKGRTIAAVARGLAATTAFGTRPPGTDVPGARGAGTTGTSPDAALRTLAQVAEELFPSGR
jgi:hypothetical protein